MFEVHLAPPDASFVAATIRDHVLLMGRAAGDIATQDERILHSCLRKRESSGMKSGRLLLRQLMTPFMRIIQERIGTRTSCNVPAETFGVKSVRESITQICSSQAQKFFT